MTVQECGVSDAVWQTLAQYLERATDDIKASFIFMWLWISCLLKVYLAFPFPFSLACLTYKAHALFYRPGMRSCMVRKLRILVRKWLSKMSKWKICTVTKIWMQHWIPLTISSVDDVLYAHLLSFTPCFLEPVLMTASALWWCWQVFDCKLHGCSQDLVFPVSFPKLKELISKILSLPGLCLLYTDRKTASLEWHWWWCTLWSSLP